MDVTIRCLCPPKRDGTPRHEQDTVTLKEALDFHGATSARNAIRVLKADDPGADAGEVLTVLTTQYLLHGIVAWTLVDEKGARLELTKGAIRAKLLTDVTAAQTVGDKADELYGESVLLPLLAQARTSSPGSPTEPSTSAKTSSSPKPRKPSKPSLIITSQTDGTVTTSGWPVPGSSSSPS